MLCENKIGVTRGAPHPPLPVPVRASMYPYEKLVCLSTFCTYSLNLDKKEGKKVSILSQSITSK